MLLEVIKLAWNDVIFVRRIQVIILFLVAVACSEALSLSARLPLSMVAGLG